MSSYESYADKWDVVKLTHTPVSREEQEREEALADVTDLLFSLARAIHRVGTNWTWSQPAMRLLPSSPSALSP